MEGWKELINMKVFRIAAMKLMDPTITTSRFLREGGADMVGQYPRRHQHGY